MASPTGSPQRDSWGSHAGFVLAAIGSAVGLGNMWRFSYVAAEGGGAAFVLLYLGFVAFVGVPVMTSELLVGRLAQVSPIEALKRLGGPRWAPLGMLFAFCGLGILSYYSVIAGWTMRYSFDAIRGALPDDAAGYFARVGTGMPAVLTHVLFMAITITIVVGGIKKGLERTAIVLMPLLFVLLVGLAIWATTLSGGGPGYAYYLRPRLSELLDPAIITDAAGQAFFSLSLGMGALMTYASYLRSKENLVKETLTIAVADFGVAFLAGLFIFPIIFHFDLVETLGLGGELNTDSTVGTLFIAMPAAVRSLGRMGNAVIAAFFIMLFFAALTSAISLLEVVVSAAIDSWHWSRQKAAIVAGATITLLGIPSALNLNVLDVGDKLVGTVLLMVGGFFTSIMVGYKILPQAEQELSLGLDNPMAIKVWRNLVRYLVPPVLLVVLIFSIPKLVTAVKTLFGV
ncbi:MAG: sodium-dependent transporter [Gemmatimonadetes bacterium]|nr:sodium-dependent transporter [Gemmatimonadota bacterium]